MNVRSTSDELDTILARNAGVLETDINRTASAVLRGSIAELRESENAAAETIGRILAYSDLLGRRRMQLLAEQAHRERMDRWSLAAAPSHLLGALPVGGVLPQVKFDEAVEDIAARMPVVAKGWEAVQKVYAERHAFACARAMTMAVTRRVQEIMREATAGGQPDGYDAVMRIMEETNWSRGYATTVYATNSSTAYSAGVWARAASPDVQAVIPGFMYVSAHLPTSRPNHEACAGLIAPTDSHLWNRFSPPLGYNSYAPGAVVEGAVVGASKAYYSGPLVNVTTRNGRRLSVTVHHPVLTNCGWRRACDIHEGSDLVCYEPNVELLNDGELRVSPLVPGTGRAVDDQHAPSRVEDVYDALCARGDLVETILPGVSALDFHGDARFFYGDVHAVRSDRVFGENGVASRGENGGEFVNVLAARGATATLNAGSTLASGVEVLCRLGSSPDTHASASESSRKTYSADPEFLRQLEHRNSGRVTLDRVVKVEVTTYRGHVYDLQTVGGWMTVDGIVSSNCKCSLLEVTVFEAERQGLIRDGKMMSVLPPGFGINARPDFGFGGGRPDRVALFGSFS